MHTRRTAIWTSLSLLAAPVAAAQQIPGPTLYPTLTASSEYRYDGLSNSSGNPALQASLYLWRPDHLYAGAWVSAVDYSGYYDPDTSYEVVLYAGRKFEFGAPYYEMAGDNTRLQFEGMYTFFPDQGPPGPTFDFFQARASLAQKIGKAELRAEAVWVPQASYGAGFAYKIEGGAKYAIADWLSVSGEYGYRESQKRADRSWWDIGATAANGRLALDLRYYDTDLDDVECGFSPNCKSAFVASLSWNLPFGGYRTVN